MFLNAGMLIVVVCTERASESFDLDVLKRLDSGSSPE